MALARDEGPHPEQAPQVLDLLERCEAQATFFCVGHRVEAHPEPVREMVRRAAKSASTGHGA